MEVKELTCIRCPLGCDLRAELEGGEVQRVSGHTCKRGEDYARQEAAHPVRTVTSTAAIRGGIRPVVAVKTVPEVPKDRIGAVMESIRALRLEAPAHIGDVVLENVAGTGSNVVVTAELPRRGA